MQRFNVLDRHQNIHQSYIIEASAGTGKTYSIENIVVRLLIDAAKPCGLEQILVVTFTRAATDDLKMRIRANLTKSLNFCRNFLRDESLDKSDIPDYLLELLELGQDRVSAAHKALKNALSNFQKAPIFTIHQFCSRMLREHLLEGNISLSNPLDDKGLSPAKVYAIIKDFFRTEINHNLISSAQLQNAITAYKGVDKLEQQLYKWVTMGANILPRPLIAEQFQKFIDKMNFLRDHHPIDPALLLEDFISQAPAYKSICNQQKQPKPEKCAIVKRFADLVHKTEYNLSDFDILISDGLYLAEVIHPENRSAKGKTAENINLHYPHFIELLRTTFGNFVDEIRNPAGILATLAIKCKKMLQDYLEQEELLDFDSLLLKMQAALSNQNFTKKIQAQFKAAVIDEFQDTDPIQWNIFKTLFKDSCCLYLVGDPKQSIYGFRQADIYTYLKAKSDVGDRASASLEVNYRSSGELIDALNALFVSPALRQLISLPRLKSSLPYTPVDSGGMTKKKKFSDDIAAVHFFTLEETRESKNSKTLPAAEEVYFFPYIASEIIRLHVVDKCNFSDFAILVSDQYQGRRLGEYLTKLHIPIIAQHCSSLTETLAFSAMRELLQGILAPRNESLLKVALGGPIISWTDQDILSMSENSVWELCISKCLALRKVWHAQGFAFFFQALMKSSWLTSNKSIGEVLLSREGGLEFYNDLQQIAEMLAEEEANQCTPSNKLLNFFDVMEKHAENEGKVIKRRGDPKKEGVQILTIHSSKGLEFEIVFALGVINRSKKPSRLIPLAQQEGLPLIAAIDDLSDPRYIEYTQELDAEKIRQLYVALTRAKQRLYIPMYCGEGLGKCELGTASPLELYLAHIGHPATELNLYDQIPHQSIETIFNYLENLGSNHSIGHIKLKEVSFNLELLDRSKSVKLVHPPSIKIAGAPEYMHSFTSLAGSSLKSALLIPPPGNFDHAEQTLYTLPAGKNTGTLLHEILETAPFNIPEYGVRSLVLQSHVGKYSANTAFKKWSSILCDIVFNAFSAHLPFENGHFSMSEVNPDLCYKEHEFIYTSTGFEDPSFNQTGYIKGVIDLIFQHQGKYYIIDWKSNWLGPNAEDYCQENLIKAMHEHHYYLQADLYKKALKRYLRLCDPRPFEEIFGGVYYLFLRGLSPNSRQGVVVI